MKHLLSLFLVVLIFPDCKAQNNKMDFEKYDPVSTLVVPEHKLTRAFVADALERIGEENFRETFSTNA